MFFHLPFHPELYSTNVTYTTSSMCLVMCKRRLKHCYVKCVENDSRKKEIAKHMQKRHKHILVPSQRNQDSRHLLQNSTDSNYVMRFSNRAQRFTGYNYLDVDKPLLNLWYTQGHIYGFSLVRVLVRWWKINFCVNAFPHCSQLNGFLPNLKHHVFVNFHFGGIGISTLITNTFGGS